VSAADTAIAHFALATARLATSRPVRTANANAIVVTGFTCEIAGSADAAVARLARAAARAVAARLAGLALDVAAAAMQRIGIRVAAAVVTAEFAQFLAGLVAANALTGSAVLAVRADDSAGAAVIRVALEVGAQAGALNLVRRTRAIAEVADLVAAAVIATFAAVRRIEESIDTGAVAT
jgi:hypothetical protein